MFTSIKSKLIIWFLSVFSIIFTGLGFFLYYKLSDIVINSVDRHLGNGVRLISGLLGTEPDEIKKELAEIESGKYTAALSSYYYMIILPDGRIIGNLPSILTSDVLLPFTPLESPARKGGDEINSFYSKHGEDFLTGFTEESFVKSYKTVVVSEKIPLRIMTQSFKLSIGIITIQAIDLLEGHYQVIHSFRNVMLTIFPAVFILCGIGIFVITDWSLSSLNVFSKKVGQITEMSLNERIDGNGMDKELRLLAVSFNTMLERLEDFFSKQSRFMSDASHELKTPTSVIKSYCDVTLRKERTAAEYQEAIQIIGEMVNRMSGIINRILDVSRLESKTFALNLSDTDLMDITEDVVKLLSPSASSRGITINLKGQRTNVKGDKERLTEMFINIVDNAIKYNNNKPGGYINIEVGSSEGWAVVTITDTGIGIPDADKERIFDRFYRVDASRSVVAGSGLGLSIVKAIVNAHSGKIEVESEAGKGSRFIVSLPKNGKKSD
ncbi:MAG: GHKL domain-containing protein [Nitrospinae bacterium]|nr:GHKL domain-containing protein [Nitrospinota bacterium]